MQTMDVIAARLSAYRTAALHPDYVRDAGWPRTGGLPPLERRRLVATCPYCGVQNYLRGLIRLGAKFRTYVRLRTGELPQVPDSETRGRFSELLLVECSACDAAIDPMAFLVPDTFLRDYAVLVEWGAAPAIPEASAARAPSRALRVADPEPDIERVLGGFNRRRL